MQIGDMSSIPWGFYLSIAGGVAFCALAAFIYCQIEDYIKRKRGVS